MQEPLLGHGEKAKDIAKRYREKNHDRILERTRRWKKEHAEYLLAYMRDWYKNNKDKVKRSRQKQYAKNPTKYRDKLRAYNKKNTERVRARNNAYTKRIKAEAIASYGGVCLCCLERQVDFLTIDHINHGRGNPAVRPSGNGSAFYAWLRARKFPKEGLQVLCFQCNWAKGIYGSCPHQLLKTPIDLFFS